MEHNHVIEMADFDHPVIDLADPLYGCTSEYSRFFCSRSVEDGLIHGIDYRAEQEKAG